MKEKTYEKELSKIPQENQTRKLRRALQPARSLRRFVSLIRRTLDQVGWGYGLVWWVTLYVDTRPSLYGTPPSPFLVRHSPPPTHTTEPRLLTLQCQYTTYHLCCGCTYNSTNVCGVASRRDLQAASAMTKATPIIKYLLRLELEDTSLKNRQYRVNLSLCLTFCLNETTVHSID